MGTDYDAILVDQIQDLDRQSFELRERPVDGIAVNAAHRLPAAHQEFGEPAGHNRLTAAAFALQD